jgi:hypothetical protein
LNHVESPLSQKGGEQISGRAIVVRDQDSQVPPRRLFTNIAVFGQEAHRRG